MDAWVGVAAEVTGGWVIEWIGGYGGLGMGGWMLFPCVPSEISKQLVIMIRQARWLQRLKSQLVAHKIVVASISMCKNKIYKFSFNASDFPLMGSLLKDFCFDPM